MRLNKFIAASSSLSRRAADTAIDAGRVIVDGHTAVKATEVNSASQVKLDGTVLTLPTAHTTILLNKPTGYVCSRNGQGSRTIYDLLPPRYHRLNPIGRLDKDSSGLLLMTDDGDLANQLTHPRYSKVKIYQITLDKPLAPLHQQMISDYGVTLEDGVSRFQITTVESRDTRHETKRAGGRTSTSDFPLYEITMREGRNRQIRRTFAALGYTVATLHRTHFGPHALADLRSGQWIEIS